MGQTFLWFTVFAQTIFLFVEFGFCLFHPRCAFGEKSFPLSLGNVLTYWNGKFDCGMPVAETSWLMYCSSVWLKKLTTSLNAAGILDRRTLVLSSVNHNYRMPHCQIVSCRASEVEIISRHCFHTTVSKVSKHGWKDSSDDLPLLWRIRSWWHFLVHLVQWKWVLKMARLLFAVQHGFFCLRGEQSVSSQRVQSRSCWMCDNTGAAFKPIEPIAQQLLHNQWWPNLLP